jgi:hypothetical protein
MRSDHLGEQSSQLDVIEQPVAGHDPCVIVDGLSSRATIAARYGVPVHKAARHSHQTEFRSPNGTLTPILLTRRSA